MGNKIKKQLNIEGTTFLGPEGTRHRGYIKHYYDIEINGSNDEKFEAFKSLVYGDEDLDKWITD